MVKIAALFILATSSMLLADTQTPTSFSGDFVIKVNYRYLLSKPEGYEDSPDKKWPLVVFLHGSGVRWVTAQRLKHMPCWIFHGDKDGAVPVENSQKIYDALKKIDAPVKLTIYPGVGHDSWTQTYANPEFWSWLFEQKKP